MVEAKTDGDIRGLLTSRTGVDFLGILNFE